jgi:iron complex outermembrane receptor protein
VGYKISNAWSVAVGANNLFNIYPNGVNPNAAG